MTNEAQVASEAVGGAVQGEAKQPELTLVDLQNIRAVIDTASRRGAFGAAEMSAVGSVFDKLNTFLNAVLPPQTEAPAPDADQQAQ